MKLICNNLDLFIAHYLVLNSDETQMNMTVAWGVTTPNNTLYSLRGTDTRKLLSFHMFVP